LTLFSWGQLFLGVPKEVLSTAAIAMLWAGKYGGFHRLFLYSLHEAEIALKLMERLQTVPETVQMARVTGLTLSDVLYKAQMVRVQVSGCGFQARCVMSIFIHIVALHP
jgi:DNA polymerase elongation subunit (family B)